MTLFNISDIYSIMQTYNNEIPMIEDIFLELTYLKLKYTGVEQRNLKDVYQEISANAFLILRVRGMNLNDAMFFCELLLKYGWTPEEYCMSHISDRGIKTTLHDTFKKYGIIK